jgi:uncharacterized protein YbjQ (UPF0145 family)
VDIDGTLPAPPHLLATDGGEDRSLVIQAKAGHREAREQALDPMVEEARALEANAVINTRFQTSMIMTGAAELLAYGTAVVLAD